MTLVFTNGNVCDAWLLSFVMLSGGLPFAMANGDAESKHPYLRLCAIFHPWVPIFG